MTCCIQHGVLFCREPTLHDNQQFVIECNSTRTLTQHKVLAQGQKLQLPQKHGGAGEVNQGVGNLVVWVPTIQISREEGDTVRKRCPLWRTLPVAKQAA